MIQDFSDFFQQLCRAHGAVVEMKDDYSVDVMFPAKVAEQLDTDELQSYQLRRPGKPFTSSTLHPEHSLVQNLYTLLDGTGRYQRLRVLEVQVRKKNREKLIQGKPVVHNGLIEITDIHEIECAYLAWNIHLKAVSEDQLSFMQRIWINPTSGYIFDDRKFGAVIDQCRVAAVNMQSGAETLNRAWRDLCVYVKNNPPEEIIRFSEKLKRRYLRDVERLNNYYLNICNELKSRALRGKSTTQKKQAAGNKMKATLEELKKKVDDLALRYGLKVQLTPVTVMEYMIPVLAFNIEVTRRKWKHNLRVYWDPLSQQVEPLFCDKCKTPLYIIFLDEEKKQVVCEKCFKNR